MKYKYIVEWFESLKGKVIRYWKEDWDEDATCEFAFIRDFYIMPDNRVLLALSPLDEEREDRMYPCVDYFWLDELTIQCQESDQEPEEE